MIWDRAFPDKARAEDSAFAVEVRRFLRDHWPSPPFRPARQEVVDRWFAALCRHGWSVPAWPVVHGGPGWTLGQRFIWERAAALAQAPAMDPVGVGLVGPLIQAQGDDRLCERYLEDIRTARSRWAEGLSGLSARGGGLCVRRVGSSHGLHGELTAVVGLNRATHVLCLGVMDGVPGLFAVALTAGGVRQVDAQTLVFAGAEADLLDPLGGGLAALDAVLCSEQAPVAVTASAEAQLERLKGVLKETSDGSGDFLRNDPGIKRRLAELEVELTALQALEARSLAQRTADGAPDAKAIQLSLRCADLERSLGELLGEAAGYYALAQPDPALMDNEPPIGPGYALPSIAGMLASFWAFNVRRRLLVAHLIG